MGDEEAEALADPQGGDSEVRSTVRASRPWCGDGPSRLAPCQSVGGASLATARSRTVENSTETSRGSTYQRCSTLGVGAPP